MSQGQSVRKLPGDEKSRIKHQRDRELNSLRQILDNEEQATQNNRNQGTAKHRNHQNKHHNYETDHFFLRLAERAVKHCRSSRSFRRMDKTP